MTLHPVLAREDVAYITSDPSNALIEGEVCAGPFIVMESVGNCPVTQMFFFIAAPSCHQDPDLLLPKRLPYCVAVPPACMGFWKS